MGTHHYSVILVRQEKIAILILVVVIAIVLASAGILEVTGKGFFSKPYTPACADGELVYYEGIVEEQSLTATGGHKILVVSGMQIFIPSSCVKENWPKVGDTVSLYGVVQTFRGEREILIRARGDINPVHRPV